MQRSSRTADAKIQALASEIVNQKELNKCLQETKSQLQLALEDNQKLNAKIAKRNRRIDVHKAEINRLNDELTMLKKENRQLTMQRGRATGKCHKQTRTAFPGEDIIAQGYIRYPSPAVVKNIQKLRDQQLTQKYVDPNGEQRRLPLVKLKANMYTAIRRRLSKRFRIRRIYTQGQGTKVDWLAEPKNQRITRSMQAKCLSTLYNCCKQGVLHWPDTDDELIRKTRMKRSWKNYKKQATLITQQIMHRLCRNP